jgi:DNA-binding response OmpR family regulator
VAKILLIDDDDDYRDFVATGLMRNGHAVTVATSGTFLTADSGKADYGTTFDVVITDVLMPDVDGLEVIRLVKAAHPGCKVIVMSAGGRFNKSGVLLHLANSLGAEFTIAKPFGIPELCHAVDGVMRARAA